MLIGRRLISSRFKGKYNDRIYCRLTADKLVIALMYQPDVDFLDIIKFIEGVLKYLRSIQKNKRKWQGWRDSNSQPSVLETAVLPIGTTPLQQI
jgi:hypothetical protein